jgi:hypothetical protein
MPERTAREFRGLSRPWPGEFYGQQASDSTARELDTPLQAEIFTRAKEVLDMRNKEPGRLEQVWTSWEITTRAGNWP